MVRLNTRIAGTAISFALTLSMMLRVKTFARQRGHDITRHELANGPVAAARHVVEGMLWCDAGDDTFSGSDHAHLTRRAPEDRADASDNELPRCSSE